ncbi:tRNA lysidine(34) synthetase TilS [Capnocytophaga sp.]|uniref:tRNA lysidine(34) synthetase TilS n=1 Tax=Capnocytophaga sp. TaxID=44737 RepID=UPI0026DCF1FD|nr:tRNA lysidine(34) synthetase TilS [Capnocytophaga sp.]MDO5105315.1 tRNA lysidine(34) synthetase TilS [Capnocytophaga sp.]
MIEKFKTHFFEQFQAQNSKILVAISGGVDSIVLAYLFFSIKQPIILAHCNFQLRADESNEDEQFVKDFGKKLGIKTITKRFNTSEFSAKSKMNTQLAARKLRYNWFEEIASENQCDFIATAHHADDNLETFIINLSRGSGLDGLTGIPQKNGKIIRPLLIFSRDAILEFARQENLQWREDSSNQTEKYIRNKIRHNILPVLKEIHPTFLTNFQKTQHFLEQSQQFIDNTIENIKKKYFKEYEFQTDIDKKAFIDVENLDFVLHKLFYPYNFKNINDIKRLINNESGKQLFSPTHQLIGDREKLYLFKLSENSYDAEIPPLIVHFHKETILENLNRKITISDLKSSIEIRFSIIERDIQHFFDTDIYKESGNDIAYMDYDSLSFPLILRHKKQGDFFYPLGMKQKKTISKFFIDEKYTLFDKEQQWLLCSGESIAWITGKRLDNRFKITEKTKKILKVEIF